MFYVYEHWRPDRDEPFYVGKGRGGRANIMKRRNAHHTAIQRKLHKLGLAVEVRIIQNNLTEQQAFDLEIKQIKMWVDVGIDLANKTTGGEGSSGHIGPRGEKHHMYGKPSHMRGKKMTEEQKKKMSLAAKGRKPRLGVRLSEETKKKISVANKGKTLGIKRPKDAEYRRKISESVKKIVQGANNPFYGKKHSEETKNKISEAKKTAYLSGEKNPMFGKTHTEETKRKISEHLKMRHVKHEPC